MLKISGVIICMAGCFGFGMLKIGGWKRDVEYLKEWMILFQKIKSRIVYQKETLEESCLRIGEKEGTSVYGVIKKIGTRAREERQNEFLQIWREEIRAWCAENLNSEEVKKLLLIFPEYVKEADEQLQMELITFYMEDLQKEKKEMEQRMKEKQKPVMAVSLVVGAVISILLI